MTNRTLGRCAVFVVLLGFAFATSAQTANWKSLSYPADGFQASFPSAPDLQKKDIATEAGSFQLRSYIAQDAGAALFVSVCDYGSSTATKDADTLLQSVKSGALQNSSSHLLREKKIMIGVNPGLEFEGQSDSAFFTFRVYLVGSTLYQTLVIAPLGKPYANTARFLDSFHLVPKPPG